MLPFLIQLVGGNELLLLGKGTSSYKVDLAKVRFPGNIVIYSDII